MSWLCYREIFFLNNFNEQKLFEILKAGIKKQFPVVDVALVKFEEHIRKG